MPGVKASSHSLRRRSRCQRPHQHPQATQCPTRMASSDQLMAHGSGLVLPRFGPVPAIHRFVADDRLAVMLAKALLELDIAIPGDWKRAERDPTSFISGQTGNQKDRFGLHVLEFLRLSTILRTDCRSGPRGSR
jgi:hypothetical protein